MVDFIRSSEPSFLLDDAGGPISVGASNGQAKKISAAMGGNLGFFLEREDGLLYQGVGGVLTGCAQVLIYEYDFATHGGAVGEIELSGPDLPADFDIWDGYVKGITELDSAADGASVQFGTKTGTTNNLKTSTVEGSFTAGAILALVPDGTVANVVTETAVKRPVMEITGEALTSGKCKLVLLGQIVA